jgi:DNA-binding NarL/FixJ family response regulator
VNNREDHAHELRERIGRLEVSLRAAQAELAELAEAAELELGTRFVAPAEDFELRFASAISFDEIHRLLTKQEKVVLRGYLECQNDKELARRMGKKLQTIRNQLASIERKLKARSRGEMIVKALAAWYERKLSLQSEKDRRVG